MPEFRDRVYLDFNATAPMRPAVREAVLARLGRTGNPSSVHAEGRDARAAVEAARSEVARLAGVPADRVTFTSGATEALGFALSPSLGMADEAPAARLLMGDTEHPAVRAGHRFPSDAVATIPVDRRGVVDLSALAERLAQPGRSVVAVQAANGETGVVQPVAEVAALVRAAGGLLVCDAVQAAGRVDIAAAVLGADVIVLSAHKIGGPQGVGALVAAREGVRLGAPLLRGGGQERGLRSGTENVPGIVGFGVAAREALQDDVMEQRVLRDRLEAGLKALAADTVIFGDGALRLPNTVSFSVPGVARETALIALDLAGVAVSTGSACSSGKVSRSQVLEAMGVDTHLCDGALRASLGWSSTRADVDRFVEVFASLVRRMQTRPARQAA